MKNWFVCASIIFGVSSTASAGAPAWCKADKPEHVNSQLAKALGDEPRDAVLGLVASSCNPEPETAKHGAEVEAARQKWSKRLEMSEADWADAADWATAGQAKRNAPTLVVDGKRAWSTYDAVDQYAAIAYTKYDARADANYLADAFGPRLTEAGRLAYLEVCARDRKVVQWAMCAGDFAVLDPKKLSTEIRAATAHTGYERMVVRLALDLFGKQRAQHAEDVKQAIAKDSAWSKAFELATATRKDWDARYVSGTARLDLALAMDDARVLNSNKAFEGCDDKTWAPFKAAVSAIPAKRFEGREDRDNRFLYKAAGTLLGSPDGYLAAVAFVTCHSGDKKLDPLVRVLGDSMQRWPGHRGPRTATQTAIMTASFTLDERGATIEYPKVFRSWFAGGGSFSGGGAGPISSVKVTGQTAVVSFEKKMVNEQECVDWKESKKITQIRGDGTIVYESWCVKEKTITVNRASSPQTVDARYTEVLRPGMDVAINENVVVAAWPKAGATLPAIVFGAPVK
jgi:hypothetical protein